MTTETMTATRNVIDELKNTRIFRMRDFVAYKENSINRVDVESNDKFRYILMAFDKDRLLAAHKAPGTAILTVLEGRAGISYKGNEFNLKEGDSIVFEKGAEHSVYATERLKVSLVLNLD